MTTELMVDQFVFLNGKITSQLEANIQINDRGFLLGDGIFETIRIFEGEPLFFDRHWQRLTKSANYLQYPVTFSKNNLFVVIKELLLKNNLSKGHASARVTLTSGVAPRGLLLKGVCNPTLVVSIFPLTPHDNSSLKVCLSPFLKNQYSPIIQHKTGNYLENIISKRDADSKGYDDALLLNTHGLITELTIANVFFIKDECVYTPPVEDGLLPGIIRSIIIELCASQLIPIAVQSLTLEDIRNMEGMFATNALMHIRQVSEVEDCFSGQSLSHSEIYNRILTSFQNYAQCDLKNKSMTQHL